MEFSGVLTPSDEGKFAIKQLGAIDPDEQTVPAAPLARV